MKSHTAPITAAVALLGFALLATYSTTPTMADTEGLPLKYECDNGARLSIHEATESVHVAMPGYDAPVYVIPARYAQGQSWFFQVEPQEMECERYCVELSMRGPVTAYARIDGAEFQCVPSP